MNDPYATPHLSQPESGVPVLEPKSLKVFGILHIIFAILGILSVLVMAVFIFAVGPLFDWLAKETGSADPEAAEMMSMMGDLYQSQIPYYIGSTLVTAVLVVFLLRAGIALVKKRSQAARLSNLWAWLTIAFVVINLPISIFYTFPAQREMQAELESSMGGASTGTESLEQAIEIGSLVLGFVASLVYPILALYFLKRKKVTDFLAQYGK
jgi:uncharacterized membrane protein YhaH (DUF805 family)